MNPSTLFLSLCLGLFTTAAWAALKPGDAAPDFTVDASRGGKEFKFSLAEALKKGLVVLYFYPKSFTSVCNKRQSTIFCETARAASCTSGIALAASGAPLPNRRN